MVTVRWGPCLFWPDEKEDHINELAAAVAHLYRVGERDLNHIFETFHEGLGLRGPPPAHPEALSAAWLATAVAPG